VPVTDRFTAVANIRRSARVASPAALERLEAPQLADDVDELAASIRRRARVTVNFHPDRLDRFDRTVAQGLLSDGRYRNQYETGISNGGRFAVEGGRRPRWESDLFGVLADDVGDRPIYGAFDLTRDPHGGSPRFGSSFLVLHARCLDRVTFCVGDSHVGPTDVGTIDELTPIVAGVFTSAAGGHGLDRGLSIDGLRRAIDEGVDGPARSLDGYVEAQIHGGVDLAADVDQVVLDPSFHGTEVEAHVVAAAQRYGCSVHLHRGSELSADDVPSDFRGPTMPTLAARVARRDGVVDAAAIGAALTDLPYSPPGPAGDPQDGSRQQHKKLWHCVLRFGSDATDRRLVD